MISQKDRIKLVMNIEEGIKRCDNEIKQCNLDLDALRDERADLTSIKDIINDLDIIASN